MLEAAGVPFEAIPAGVDEDAAKASLRAEGVSPRELADALAELKSVKLSTGRPDALVLGCDQVAALDGTVFDKPASREEAADQLRQLRGRRHRQISVSVMAQDGAPVWRHADIAYLTVRDFSDAWLEAYLDAEWPAIGGCAGGYRLEGLGAQLFLRVEGSHFTVLGLPLLPVLAYLRERGVVEA